MPKNQDGDQEGELIKLSKEEVQIIHDLRRLETGKVIVKKSFSVYQCHKIIEEKGNVNGYCRPLMPVPPGSIHAEETSLT
jgi:hypothetical protein